MHLNLEIDLFVDHCSFMCRLAVCFQQGPFFIFERLLNENIGFNIQEARDIRCLAKTDIIFNIKFRGRLLNMDNIGFKVLLLRSGLHVPTTSIILQSS